MSTAFTATLAPRIVFIAVVRSGAGRLSTSQAS
jgi:hypothetical protein